jgi:hypothetical protein
MPKTRMKTTFKISIFVFCFLGLLACKKEEKILYKDQKNKLEGTWYLDKIVFYDLLNDSSAVTNTYFDSKPLVPHTSYDDQPAQFTLLDDGTYTSISHRLGIYFALIGNQSTSSGNTGLWQLVENGTILYFDQGVYEFEGSSPRYYTITQLTNDSLKLETSEPQAVYDWAYLYGLESMALDLYPLLFDGCTSADKTYGGQEFAATYGAQLGYQEATLKTPITLNPFGIGLRRGLVNAFNQIYSPTKVPKFDSCYQANLPSYYASGFNAGSKLPSTVHSRFSKITFVLSRNPDPNGQ